MAAATRAETLIKAIKDLADVTAQSWRQAQLSAARGTAIDSARLATRQAIEALDPSRLLFTSEVAVLFDLSERHTLRKLQGPPKELSFVQSREGKRPPGYKSVSRTLEIFDGRTTTKMRPVYVRAIVMSWWESQKKAEADREKEKEIVRLENELKALDQKIKGLRTQRGALKTELQQANARLHAKLLRGTWTMEETVMEPQPYLVSADRTVLDHAWLPVSNVDQIAKAMNVGGTVEWITLHQAITARVWANEGVQRAWHVVWLAAINRADSQAQAMRASIRSVRDSSTEGLADHNKIRS